MGEVFNELALRRPERPDHVIVVSIYDLIDRRFDVQQVVSRHSEDAIRLQHSPRFRIETVQIEPVQCLRDHDQVNRVRLYAAVFCGRDKIVDALVQLTVCDLFLTCVGCDHAIEH